MMSVHTLDARDNIILDVTFADPASIPTGNIRAEIMSALATTTDQLRQRRIDYTSLRTALTPQVDKREIALLFNSEVMDNWYGIQAAHAVLPSLPRRSNHSILTGDITFKNEDLGFSALEAEAVVWGRPTVSFLSSIYVVYVTNLGTKAYEDLLSGVRDSPGAIGFVDCTFAGASKTIFATCIGTTYLKAGSAFLNSHPFDCEPGTNENGPSWPVEDFGYRVASIDDLYFDLFLRYKIESSVPGMAHNDGHFSFAAASGRWRNPRSLPIVVDDAKIGYLRTQKGGSLSKAGLDSLTGPELVEKLHRKLSSSYIYNLAWNSSPDYSNFAAMVEFEHQGRKSRLRAVLACDRDQLRLVSLFG